MISVGVSGIEGSMETGSSLSGGNGVICLDSSPGFGTGRCARQSMHWGADSTCAMKSILVDNALSFESQTHSSSRAVRSLIAVASHQVG